MSRYNEYQQKQYQKFDSSDGQQFNQEQNLVCVKNLLSKPIPLMNKIQYKPYEAKTYYPVLLTKLPTILSNQQYHIDKNNMVLIDETLATHQKFKMDIAKCLSAPRPQKQRQLVDLKQYYENKSAIYEKINLMNEKNSNYFATFVLNIGSISKKQINNIRRNSFSKGNITQRPTTERMSLGCRSRIEFNSNFQSGNLYKVYQKQFNQYDLVLQNDINTKGNNQWFFFSVRNVPKCSNIKFNIVNMSKKYSLFQLGMKPAVFSMMKFQKRKIGWVRDCSKVFYRQSSELKKQSSNDPYYKLSFQYNFTYQGDIVYFSYAIPYTFSNLSNYLSNKLSNKYYHQIVKIRSIGETIGGNQVNLFQITDRESKHDKKSIWIIARQHPGQVTSSFMLEGMMDYLLTPEASFLRKYYVFKIIPMINIDGVVHGNTRAQLVGCDSNRVWQNPHKVYNPIVYALKKKISNDNIQMVLDLHSHSRKLGTFFYTNNLGEQQNLTKIFPIMVCKEDQRFDYRSNRYRGGSNKTARKVLYDQLGIPFIYTVESSFYGYQKQGDFKIYQYQPSDYRQMGAVILKTFSKLSQSKIKHQIIDQRLLLNGDNQDNEDIWAKMNEVDQIQSVGSDDCPQEDQFSKKQLQMILPGLVKKKKKTKNIKIIEKPKQVKKNDLKILQNQPKLKKIDKDSYYKKYFSGKWDYKQQFVDAAINFKKQKRQTKNYGCQVDIPQKKILKRSSTNNIQTQRINFEKLFQKKNNLFVIGQKVQDEFVVFGNTVAVQAVPVKNLFISRNELTTSLSKRNSTSRVKANLVMLHNQNNFLNRGDMVHGIRTFYYK